MNFFHYQKTRKKIGTHGTLITGGTKWDVGGENADCDEVDDNTLQLNFDSAWSPPIAGFRGLTDLGFEIEATYIEEGEAFVGEYSSEGDNDHYEIEERTAEWVEENIPSHLDEKYGISQRFLDDEIYEEEEDDDVIYPFKGDLS